MFGLFKRKKEALIPVEQQQIIVEAIKNAECQTSGEIRVFIESRCSYINAIDRASEIFYKLKMENTTNKNAVLVYVALVDHQMALFGDEGIYKKTGGDRYWQSEIEIMRKYFERGLIAEGIANCVLDIGNALKSNFPFDKDNDKNELPNDIVFGQ